MIGNAHVSLAVAFVASLVLGPIMWTVARRYDWIDTPEPGSAHRNPTALFGGIGIYGAVLSGLLAAGGPATDVRHAGLYVGATLLAVVGLWDDRRALSPRLKLLATLIAALVVIASGTRWPATDLSALQLTLTLVWLVSIPHAINLLDHLDGVAGGIAAIAAACLVVVAAGNGGASVAAMAAALAGACGAFLVYNLPPARIFLGDAGSLPIGLVLAALSLEAIPATATSRAALLFPPLVLLVAICDTALVTVSRLLRGSNPITPGGTDHSGHRLRARFGHLGALAILYGTAAVGGSLAVWLAGRSGAP